MGRWRGLFKNLNISHTSIVTKRLLILHWVTPEEHTSSITMRFSTGYSHWSLFNAISGHAYHPLLLSWLTNLIDLKETVLKSRIDKQNDE